MRTINRIFIHVSDSPDTLDIGTKEITRWHSDPPPKGNGWSDIGYHGVVRRNGVLELGRPISKIGSHAKGHNSDSIGLCWVGRTVPTAVQYQSLLNATRLLMAVYGIKADQVLGHKEVDPGKSCPNLDMVKFRKDLA